MGRNWIDVKAVEKKNPVQNLVRAVVKPGMGEHGNVFWRPQFPLPAGEIVWQ